MMLRSLCLGLLGAAFAGPVAAQAPEQLSCTLGKATVYATIDSSDGKVQLTNARNSKTQDLSARFTGTAVSFSDGEDPVALSYTINRQTMRIDRWVSDGDEGRTHLDDGKCRALQIADVRNSDTSFRAP